MRWPSPRNPRRDASRSRRSKDLTIERLESRLALSGTIQGLKFHDPNVNGLRDPGETALGGWTVFLDQDNNGRLDAGEPSRVTAPDGSFTFDNLGAGTYNVTETPQSGWMRTFPTPAGGAQSVLIPVTDRRDLIYDPTRGLLDISTGSGYIQRYDVASQTLLSPVRVGTSLTGMDLSSDGGALYVGDARATYATLHRLDLATNTVTDLRIPAADFNASGVFDVAIGASGKGLVSSSYGGSGPAPISTLDVAAGTLTNRTDVPGSINRTPPEEVMIARSADRSLLLLVDTAVSPARYYTYDPATNTFPGPYDRQLSGLLNGGPVAVNRDGSLIALVPARNNQPRIYDRGLNLLHTLPYSLVRAADAGMAFDPARDLLYAADAGTDTIYAIDTNTWTEKFHMAAGEDIVAHTYYDNGEMTVSSDGKLLFLSTPSGVRMYRTDVGAYTVNLVAGQDVTGLNFGAVSTDQPGVTVDDVTVTEGDAASVAANFTVRLSFAAATPVTVNFATADGTATAGSDYVAASGALTFAPGETSRTISVPLVGDTVGENEEAFFLNLTGATNALVADGQGQARVLDSDPQITIDNVAVVEGNTGTTTALFTVRVSPVRDQPLTVGYSTADGTATAGSDYVATSGALTFAPGETSKTIAVPVLTDTFGEANGSFTVVLTTPTLSVAAPVHTSGLGSATYPGEAVYNGALYFVADDGVTGPELWKYDGATATLAADIQPGSAGSTPLWLTVYNGALYFTADDGVHGRELWKYDGVTATLAADIGAGSNGSNPGWPTVYHGVLYFGAWDGLTFGKGVELWSFDGTTARLVSDIVAGTGSSSPAVFEVADDLLYFAATTPATGQELYATNGVSVWLAADIQSGTFNSGVAELVAYQGDVFFKALAVDAGRELRRFDGSSASLVADIYPGLNNSNPGNLTVTGNALYFVATDGVTGYEPYKYDGTTVTRLGEIVPGAGPSNSLASNFISYGGTVFFQADDGVHGSELWQYDGAGISLFRDINPGAVGSSPSDPILYNGVLYFQATGQDTGRVLWKYDLNAHVGQGTATILDDDPASTASFVATDTTTQGNWKGSYGTDGFSIAQDPSANNPSLPSYATVAVTGATPYAWNSSTADPRAPLQASAGSTNRIASTWYSGGSFTLDVNITDGLSHRVALYALDWDGAQRTETVEVINATTGAVLDSRTLANFQNGVYLVWNLSGNVRLKVTNTGPSNAVATALFFGDAAVPATASFVATDTTTQGNWKGSYGTDGFVLAQDPSGNNPSLPSYATVAVAGAASYTWNGSTVDSRAPLQAAAGSTNRIASTWYSGGSFSIDVNLSDGLSHRVALYALDWDRAQRTETVEVIDVATGTVLDSRTLADFQNGVYLVWNLSGNVRLKVTRTGPGNAVATALFFGNAVVPAASAAFVATDTTTQGNWKGTYGADGFVLAQDPSGNNPSLPSYATVAVAGAASYTWNGSTVDSRAPLQAAAGSTNRIASTWYSGGSFSIDVNLSDGLSHRVALYALDWDGAQRAETVEVIDVATGTVLDTRVLADFQNGVYLVWNLKGNVRLRVTNTGPSNAVATALFFG